jgi:hypothetical protein
MVTYYSNSLIVDTELKHPWLGMSEKQILNQKIKLEISYFKESQKIDQDLIIYLKDLPARIKSFYKLKYIDKYAARKFIISTVSDIFSNLLLGRLERLDLIDERTVELFYMFEEFELQENDCGYDSDIECLTISIEPLSCQKPKSEPKEEIKTDNILRSYMSGLVIYEKQQQIILQLPDTKDSTRHLVEVAYNKKELINLIADMMEAANVSISELNKELRN